MRGAQLGSNPLSSTTPLTNFIRHGRLQRLRPPPPLSLRIPLACGCWNFRRTSGAIAKVSAPRPRTRKVCSLDHALPLSVTGSLPQLCDNGGPSSPDASGSSTLRERMARRAPTGICGTVQPVTGGRESRARLLEEACQRTSITAPDI